MACGEGVVEKDSVGASRFVIARKPDLIDAVVQRDNSVIGHGLAHVGNEALRIGRETVVFNAFGEMAVHGLGNAFEIGEVPAVLGLKAFVQFPDAMGNISDELDLGKIDRVHGGGVEIHVEDSHAAGFHEEGRLLNNVVTNIDDEICALNRAMNEVSRREGCVPKKEGIRVDSLQENRSRLPSLS